VKKPILVVLIGPPGSGKGTQAKRLTETNPSWKHVSTGDLFRKEIASNSPLGLEVKGIIAQGKLVSDEQTNRIFESQTTKIIKEMKPQVILLDGYPRNKAQAKALLSYAKTLGIDPPKTLELSVSQSEVLSRLGGRLVNPRTGRVYHKVHNPPKKAGFCDEDGGELIQRPDDQPETIKSRYALFMGERNGILEVLKTVDPVVHSIDGNQDPAMVEKALETKIKSWF
jgi:adenylate kinase